VVVAQLQLAAQVVQALLLLHTQVQFNELLAVQLLSQVETSSIHLQPAVHLQLN
jgi:hypothetical protein